MRPYDYTTLQCVLATMHIVIMKMKIPDGVMPFGIFLWGNSGLAGQGVEAVCNAPQADCIRADDPVPTAEQRRWGWPRRNELRIHLAVGIIEVEDS